MVPDEPLAQLLPSDLSDDDPGNPVMLRVRSRLAAGRRALGLEPELLDAVCGFRDGTVARLEAGRRRVAPAHLVRLANVFDVDVDWFFADHASPLRQLVRSDCGTAPSCEETRRFLALYARLQDHRVRDDIRLLVNALANSACGRPGAGLPLPLGDLPPDR